MKKKDNIYVNRTNILNHEETEITASIVVVAYNRLEVTKLCVESVLKYTKDVNYKLILVCNNSEYSEGILEYFEEVQFKNKEVVYIEKNIGAPYSYRKVRNYFEGKYIVHLPNDVIVTTNWLSNLIKCAESDEKIGIVNPVSSNVSNHQQVDLCFKDYDDMQKVASEYNLSDPKKWHERIRLITLGTLFTRECLSAIGDVFDIGFVHDFGDDDVSFRARRAGYKIILAMDTWVHHEHTFSSRIDYNPENGRNCFREKYFGIDAWDDTCNFLSSNVVDCIKQPFSNDVNILGIDVKCGTPLLDLKNTLRNYNIFNLKASAFMTDSKYLIDLKTICNDTVISDRIDYLNNSFKRESFDYIVIGSDVNQYSNPEKLVYDSYTLLKKNGQMFFPFKNIYNLFVLLTLLGHEFDYENNLISYDIKHFCRDIKKIGLNYCVIDIDSFTVSKEINDYINTLIQYASPDNADKNEIYRNMVADRYWIRVVK